ncbi:MAG: gamma-glutamyl-gamma-aminobutyrate hydrolase family protein [Roseibium sp.]
MAEIIEKQKHLKIAISQRVDMYEMYMEERDGLATDWQICLSDLFGREILLFPITNNPLAAQEVLEVITPDIIVLTGGNDISGRSDAVTISHKREDTERTLLSYSIATNCPVFAVCRGFQFLNNFAGGKVFPIKEHVAAVHDVFVENQNGNASIFTVNSFHNFTVPANGLSKSFQIVAQDKDGNVEAARHEYLPWLGIMWHPERTNNSEAATRWLRTAVQRLVTATEEHL